MGGRQSGRGAEFRIGDAVAVNRGRFAGQGVSRWTSSVARRRVKLAATGRPNSSPPVAAGSRPPFGGGRLHSASGTRRHCPAKRLIEPLQPAVREVVHENLAVVSIFGAGHDAGTVLTQSHTVSVAVPFDQKLTTLLIQEGPEVGAR